jgi:hypothetical protein
MYTTFLPCAAVGLTVAAHDAGGKLMTISTTRGATNCKAWRWIFIARPYTGILNSP